MKLLLDENLPVKLKFRLIARGIEAFTVTDKKWNSKKNGELLSLMLDESFTHLLTFDRGISFQQNFLTYPVCVVIIIAPSNNYAIIMDVFDEIVATLNKSQKGAISVLHPLKK
jgi:predicted nuclease of predicted toxin-antitoxin system